MVPGMFWSQEQVEACIQALKDHEAGGTMASSEDLHGELGDPP